MYHLEDPLTRISGIGTKIAQELAKEQIFTLNDLLLLLPLRYEDRTLTSTIADLLDPTNPPQPKQTYTLLVKLVKINSTYGRGKSIQRATFVDESGDLLYATWFHNPHLAKNLRVDEWYRVNGVVKIIRSKLYITQPVVELEEKASVNTNRLVPIYPQFSSLKPTILRKIFLEIWQNLEPIHDHVPTTLLDSAGVLPLHTALSQLHLPTHLDQVASGRRRLALEELLVLINHSRQIKESWSTKKSSLTIDSSIAASQLIPAHLPFKLTEAQHRAIGDILHDMRANVPMNRLLLGDVGSGKTLVAAAALQACVISGAHSCLIAPTQVLAKQHFATLSKLYPESNLILITGHTKKNDRLSQPDTPTIFIGTHAVLNMIETEQLLTKIGLIVFDEQHRFGVKIRSTHTTQLHQPHTLTMTATPIPRSLMLTIFAHLSLSVLDELPANRLPTKTWLVPEEKRRPMLDWIADQIHSAKQAQPDSPIVGESRLFQALVVCPFIDPSHHLALENVASVTKQYEALVEYFASTKIKIGLLHGRQSQAAQTKLIQQLRQGEIDIVVTTPIVEVGIDLPQASCIVIEDADRFGLASLHQLRGRVGRAGQQGYCLVFHNEKSKAAKNRLSHFAQTLSGAKLAEYDLNRRGAGDIFGTQQHGFDDLKFASWSDIDLISLAKRISDDPHQQHFTSHILKPKTLPASTNPLAAN